MLEKLKQFFNRNKIDATSFEEVERRFKNSAPKSVSPRPEFKSALFAQLRSKRKAFSMEQSTSRKSFKEIFVQYRPSFVAGTAFVVLLAVVVGVFYGFRPGSVPIAFAQDNFTLEPTEQDSAGIAPNSSFILKSKEPITKDEIKAQLALNPEVDYALNKISDTEWKINLKKDLNPNQVVTVEMNSYIKTSDGTLTPRPYSWAYQVKGPFHLVGTLPANKSNSVPKDSGIEFTFSHANVKDIGSHVTFSPATTGRWEQYRKTWVFVPKELKAETVYTVTVDGSLGLIDSDATLGASVSFQFETSQSDRQSIMSLSRRLVIANPQDAPEVGFYSYGSFAGRKPHVTLYRFPDTTSLTQAVVASQNVFWTSFTTADAITDRSKLLKVSEFDAMLKDEDYTTTAVFPEALKEGGYLAIFSLDDQQEWVLLESSSIGVYAAKATNKTLIWATDGDSNKPLAGAAVSDHGRASATTNDDGLATLPANVDSSIFVVSHDSRVLVYPISLPDWYNRNPRYYAPSEWWKYFYTDRPIYQPTDTVNFWGYFERRADGMRPATVDVKLIQNFGYNWISGENNEAVYAQTTVDVSKRGMAKGTLSFDGLPSGYYTMIVSTGGDRIAERSFQIYPYVKPAYSLSVVPSTDAVFSGSPVDWIVSAAFFDGTPVKSLPLTVVDDNKETHSIVTDEMGTYRLHLTPEYHPHEKDSDWDNYPTSWGVTVRPSRPEEGEISARAQTVVFGPHLGIMTESHVEGQDGLVAIDVRKIEAMPSFWIEDYGKQKATNQPIHIEVIKDSWKKEYVGESYDFINKVVYKTYNYTQNPPETVNTADRVTDVNGLAQYRFPYHEDELATYRVRVTATDGAGRVGVGTAWVARYQYSSFGFDPNRFDLVDDDLGSRHVGDQVSMHVEGVDGPLPNDGKWQYLYYQTHLGIGDTLVTKSPAYQFTFTDAHVPNVGVTVVGFNGKLFRVAQAGVYFENRDHTLDVTITTDKERYKPGEEAKIHVHVAKQADGSPVSAEVNVNLVDEAVYAIAGESVDPLGSLLETVDSGVIWSESSHEANQFFGGAEKGGGGGEARMNFRDLALFASVTTDRNGDADVSVKLPDNVTSWRVTTQAIAPEGKYAGKIIGKVPVSLPFFVLPVMKNQYLVGDAPEILMSAYGTSISPGADVTYTIKIPDVKFEKNVTGKAGSELAVALPPLAVGTHQIEVSGTSAGLRDSVIRPVTMVQSFLRKPVVASQKLSNDMAIPGAMSGLTYVLFTDAARGAYYDTLVQLAGQYGDRLDQRMTRIIAGKMLKDEFNDDRFGNETISIDSYRSNGGFAILPYASNDLELTAKIAALHSDLVDPSPLTRYFNDKLNGHNLEGKNVVLNAHEAAAAYFGLAASGEPVLLEVQQMSARTDLDVDTKLYLALALDELGAKESARTLYRSIITEQSKQDRGAMWLTGESSETIAERTALAAILAADLVEPQHEALENYLISTSFGNTLLVIENVLDVDRTLRHLPSGDSQIEYTMHGKQERATLGRGKTLALYVNSADREALHPKLIKGTVRVATSYETPIVDVSDPTDARLNLLRTYSAVGGATTRTFARGDIVKVEISYKVPSLAPKEITSGTLYPSIYDSFEIVDVLPAGLAMLTESTAAVTAAGGTYVPCAGYPERVAEQRVYFNVTDNPYCGNRFSYYARVVTPGTYRAEPAYIRSDRDPKVANHTPMTSEAITIK